MLTYRTEGNSTDLVHEKLKHGEILAKEMKMPEKNFFKCGPFFKFIWLSNNIVGKRFWYITDVSIIIYLLFRLMFVIHWCKLNFCQTNNLVGCLWKLVTFLQHVILTWKFNEMILTYSSNNIMFFLVSQTISVMLIKIPNI